MVCQACGAAVVQGVAFCSQCGTQVLAPPAAYAGYPPPMPPMYLPSTRVQRHMQTLGILWCVFGGYRVLVGLIGMFFLKAMALRGFGDSRWGYGDGGPFGSHFMAALVPFIAVYTAVVVALAFFVGFSLLTRKPWGRTLAIVAGCLSLLKPIFGTALGIYTLWVLAPAASGDEYERIADRS